ncbi:DUF4331 family protein [Croceicoccus mobilis]|uniref:DUF4331 domain-containing protein n=1 Tax=Croceicoccus mobilis TaxID=1703339 RepID=A0A916YUY3_9SPHN|nr:DUF4331 family protein [Croceicoccus mobilis]GGD62248.1 hypothetical protein GCM10010990_09560 [Croceicoccus mobilis]
MNRTTKTRAIARLAPVALATMLLTSCGGDDNGKMDDPITMTPSPTPAPTPTPTPTPTTYDVTACLTQEVAPGVSVADLVVPDTLTLNLSAPSGFPNGRMLPDPVIDVTLAVIFLDLQTHGANTLAGLPLNPPGNDVQFQPGFPYLAAAQGTPPLPVMGSGFDFRSDDPADYTRVDRMGMPAVSTALIGSDLKNAYNDADPTDDANGDFVPEISDQLAGLTNALADDLVAAGLTPCAEEA